MLFMFILGVLFGCLCVCVLIIQFPFLYYYSNFNVCFKGNAVLCDFETSKHENAPYMSTTSVPINTPRYAAPETADGKSFSYKSDIYSLGLVICEILCGSAPKNAAAATRDLSAAIKDQKQIDLLKEVCLQCLYICAFHAATLSSYIIYFPFLDAQL